MSDNLIQNSDQSILQGHNDLVHDQTNWEVYGQQAREATLAEEEQAELLKQQGVEESKATEVIQPYQQTTSAKINELLKLGLPNFNPVDGSVPPRPASQGGRNKNQDRWDSMYGATHFPDGSMK